MKKTNLIWTGVLVVAILVTHYVSKPSGVSAPVTGVSDAPTTNTSAPKTSGTSNTTAAPRVQTPLPAPTPASSATLPATNTIKAKSVTVSILEEEFSPKNITVTKGTTVTWVNRGTKSHIVKAPPGGPLSPTLKPGQSYSFTFTIAGTVNYNCAIHPGIGGTINVVE